MSKVRLWEWHYQASAAWFQTDLCGYCAAPFTDSIRITQTS